MADDVAFFSFARDWDTNIPMATRAWQLVVARLTEGAKMIDLILAVQGQMEATPPGPDAGLEPLFLYAIWNQLMKFLGELIQFDGIPGSPDNLKGAQLIDLILAVQAQMEATPPRADAGLEPLFLYAIWNQLMQFVGVLIECMEQRGATVRGEERAARQYFSFERDWDGSAPFATVTWRKIVEHLYARVQIVELLREAIENMREAGESGNVLVTFSFRSIIIKAGNCFRVVLGRRLSQAPVLLIDLLREAEDNVQQSESEGLARLYYYAIWHQLILFLGELIIELDRRA
ncbi:hypothetical protein G7046_g4358 [Stylonectria norvegica]|nr:hypothetical protein G7046_g4358 [Stylonectria norvegica]